MRLNMRFGHNCAMLTALLALVLATDAGPQRLDAGDRWIAYEVVGQGEPVVLLAGGPGFAGEVLRPVADMFDETNACILFDQLGTGQSRWKEPGIGTAEAEIIEDLETLRKHLGHEKWTVFGQSWGSYLAVLYAAAHPSSVDRLVLASNPLPTDDGMDVLGATVDARMTARERVELERILASSADMEEKIEQNFFRSLPYYFYDAPLGKRLLKEFDRSLLDPLAAIQLLAYYRPYKFRDAATALRDWPGDTLVVQGHQDPSGALAGQMVAESLPNAHLVYINRCGHFPWLEQPEPFALAVREFLAKRAE
jgi:proline iminopeptidase